MVVHNIIEAPFNAHQKYSKSKSDMNYNLAEEGVKHVLDTDWRKAPCSHKSPNVVCIQTPHTCIHKAFKLIHASFSDVLLHCQVVAQLQISAVITHVCF